MTRPRRDWPFAVFATALAFVLRFAVARRFLGEPVWDGHYYDYYARRIADGFGYTDQRIVDGVDIGHASCHYPVGFSAALGAVYRVFGQTPQTVSWFNALCGALVVTCTWALARRVFETGDRDGRWRTRLSTLLVCLHPGLLMQAALVMSETLATLTTLASLVIAVELRARGRAWQGALVGAVCLGVSALVRPPALFLVPFLLPWNTPLPRVGSPWLSRAVGMGALVAASLLPIAPWTARNCAVMDSCALVSTNGGWNLAIGAFPRATGRFETLRSSDGCREVTGQVQQDRCWLHYGVDHIVAAPGHWLGLWPKKLHYTFDHESFPIEYLHEARPAQWPEERRALGRDVLSTAHRLLVLLAAAAIVRVPVLRRRRRLPEGEALRAGAAFALVLALAFAGMNADEPWVWPLALVAAAAPFVHRTDAWAAKLAGAVVASVVLTSVLFFGEDRYHVVASPALCLLAAMAFRPRAPRARAKAAAVVYSGACTSKGDQ